MRLFWNLEFGLFLIAIVTTIYKKNATLSKIVPKTISLHNFAKQKNIRLFKIHY